MRWGRGLCAVCIAFVCLGGVLAQAQGASPVTSLVQELSNNTSACSSSADLAGNLPYCFTFFNGFAANANDTAAETPVPVSPTGHVSNLSIHQLMYPGWTGKVICEYQPWFGASNHQSVGYDENSAATVAAQDSFMIAEGCDINLIDFYGALDPSQGFNLATTNAIFSDLSGRPGYPLKFGVMEDKNALVYSCPVSGQTETATVTCLENALIAEMDYVNTHYANSPVYFTDAGHPLIFSFVTPSCWPVLTAADWDTIWSTLKAHTDTYTAPFEYVFEFGSFTTAPYDNGRYAWVQPPVYSSTQQFWWGSVTSASPTYLDTFYSAAVAHPSQLAIGGIWKGFDDSNASWSGNRVIAQQCGQVLLKTAAEISKYFGGTNPQISYVQVATWNDYEEGTAVEPGIDNCYTVSASLSGNQLTWSLLASDSTYASTSTIYHFNIYYADAGGNLYTAAANLPVSTTTLDLSALPSGTWNLYVEMVGQPLIINRMSSAVTFAHGPAAASLSPASLSFTDETVGMVSGVQNVTLTNTGQSPLTIYGVNIGGDFGQNNNCPGSLATGATCIISLSFGPSAAGARTGSLQVSDSASSVPQLTTLAGTGILPAISFSAAGLTFAAQTLATTSSMQAVTLTNAGPGILNIGGMAVTGDFALNNSTCSGTMAPSASCTFNISFTPSATGTRTGSLVVTSNAVGGNTMPLNGSGSDFGVVASPAEQTVPAGTSASFTISVPSVGASFGSPITLSCTGLPMNASCAFLPVSLNADTSATLVLSTKASEIARRKNVSGPPIAIFALLLHSGTVGFLGLVMVGGRTKFRKSPGKPLAMALVALIAVGISVGCGSQPTAHTVIPGTPGGTYTLTVAASSGALSHTASLTLNVK